MSLSASEEGHQRGGRRNLAVRVGGIFDEAHQDVQTALLNAPSARGRILQQQAAKSSRARGAPPRRPLGRHHPKRCLERACA